MSFAVLQGISHLQLEHFSASFIHQDTSLHTKHSSPTPLSTSFGQNRQHSANSPHVFQRPTCNYFTIQKLLNSASRKETLHKRLAPLFSTIIGFRTASGNSKCALWRFSRRRRGTVCLFVNFQTFNRNCLNLSPWVPKFGFWCWF